MKTLLMIRWLEVADQPVRYGSCLISDNTTSDWLWHESLEQLAEATCEQQYETVGLLLSGQRVGQSSLLFSRSELRHLNSLAPYQLEDELIGAVDELHFVYGAPQKLDDQYEVKVSWIDKLWLRDCYQQLESHGLTINHCWMDADLIDQGDDSRWVFQLDGTLLVSLGDGRHYALDAGLAGDILDRLAVQEQQRGAQLPQSLLLLADDQQAVEQLQSYLPESLGSVDIETRVETLRPSSALLSRAQDFARGEFAMLLPYARWWREWRLVSWLLLAALTLYVVVGLVQVAGIQSQKQQLQADVESAYRSAVPQGAMVDPERQLRQKVGGSSQSSSSEFLPVIALVTPVLAQHKGIQVASMNYQSTKHELRLSVESESFSDIEKFRSSLNAGGVKAELLNSSSRQDKHQAKLNITRVQGK